MGAGHSAEVQVQFDRPNALYYPGELITGVVSLRTSEQAIKLQSISVQLVGECDYTTPDIYHFSDGTGYSHEEYRVMHHCATFLNIPHCVIHSKGNKHVEVPHHGQCSWPFEFLLPSSLPPSTSPSTGSHPCVRYYTGLVLNKSRYQRNIKQTYPLTILPKVNLFHLEDGRRSVFQCHSSRRSLQFHVYLHHRGVLPGQAISLDIDLQNPERFHIEKTVAKLIQHHKVVSDYRKEIIFQVDLPALVDFDGTELHQTFELQVPSVQLSPTYQCRIKARNSSMSINTYYELKLTTTVRGMSDHMNFSIPILVGTESLPGEPSAWGNDSIDMPISYTAALEETESPPDYESAVRTIETKSNETVQ